MTPPKLYQAIYGPYNPPYQIWLRYILYFSFNWAENYSVVLKTAN